MNSFTRCFAVVLLLGFPLALSAEVLFVTSKVCYLYEKPSAGAAKTKTLAQGDKLEVVTVQDKWLQVKTSAGTGGWVSKMFVGKTASVVRTDTGAAMSDLSSVATRTRASAYTTSAAATRGLSSDNVRQRENLSFSDYDFSIAPWLDTFRFTDERIAGFTSAEGLAP